MKLLLSISFVLFFQLSFAQVRQEWIALDISLINSVNGLDKQNCHEVEAFFVDKKYPNPRTNFGFGWSMYKLPVGRGAGYISVYADLYYFNDSLTSYVLSCRVPQDSLLWEEYIQMYLKTFEPDSNMVFLYKHNVDALNRPVGKIDSSIRLDRMPGSLLEYMSPRSGIVYGNRGGFSNSILQNRRYFNSLKSNLTYQQLIALMHSINPASRFTAIEYYLRNKRQFPRDKEVDAWIEKVLEEVPKIPTMFGCIMREQNSRELLANYSHLKRDPD